MSQPNRPANNLRPGSRPAPAPAQADSPAPAAAPGTPAQRSNAPFTPQDLNRIVLEYLAKKGYHRTEQMLRVESSRSLTPPVGSLPNASNSNLPNPEDIGRRKRDNAGNEIVEFEPQMFYRSYGLLKNWVESSLDLYKPELARLMYPVFVYSFLDLIKRGYSDEARTFFDKFCEEHKLLHSSEISKLFSIQTVDHIKENELAQGFTNNKYTVTITRTTLNLLLFFLQENEAIGASVIIGIINTNLDPLIVSEITSKTTVVDGIKNISGMLDVDTFNAQSVKLGKFPQDEDFTQEVAKELEKREEKDGQGKTLSEQHQEMTALDDDSPSKEILPLPAKTALDLKLEIQRVREARDAIRLDQIQACAPSVCQYTFHNTNGDMTNLEFSDDALLVAAGFQDSYVKVWSLDGSPLKSALASDTHTGSSRKLIGHAGPVYGLSFSPDNKFLLSSSEDKTVRLWSLDTYTPMVVYKGHNHPVWDVKFSPLGHYFATASHDQTARLWSCDHIYPLRIFAGHMNDVDCVDFHPNSTYVFTGSSDKTCRMWDISTGNAVRLFLGHSQGVCSTAVSPDGRWLATASEEGLINLWDIGSGKRLKMLRGHGKGPINSLAFSQDGAVLVSAGSDMSVRVWDIKKGTLDQGPEPQEPFTADGDFTTSVQNDMKDYGRRKLIVPTPDLMASFFTKRTPVYKVKFTRGNLVLSGGVYT